MHTKRESPRGRIAYAARMNPSVAEACGEPTGGASSLPTPPPSVLASSLSLCSQNLGPHSSQEVTAFNDWVAGDIREWAHGLSSTAWARGSEATFAETVASERDQCVEPGADP